MSDIELSSTAYSFLRGDGEMATLIRSFDWSQTPIGTPSAWPTALKIAISNMLASKLPMHIACGSDLVQLYNDNYLPIGKSRHPKALGRPLKETHKDIWESIGNMYEEAFAGKPMGQTNFKMSLDKEGTSEDCYFDFSYSPIFDENGKILGVLTNVTDRTERVRAIEQLKEAKSSLEKAHAETARQKDALKTLVMNARYALAILRGPDFVVELTNHEIDNIWAKSPVETWKRALMDIFPELKGQPFPTLLKQVYDTGVGYKKDEEELFVRVGSNLLKKYISFSYDPLFDIAGNVIGIIVSADDISAKVEARNLLEQSHEQLRMTNAQLATANAGLLAANDRLHEFNEELTATQADLQNTLLELKASETRFRSLIKSAPVCITVLQGPDFIIEAANDEILKLWGKKEDVIGKPILSGTPELETSEYLQVLRDVFRSGKPYKGNEARTIPGHQGATEETYFNFIFQPILHDNGQTTGIMVVGVDVSEQVAARRELQKAEEMHRFSIDAANAATWFMDVDSGDFIVNERLKELFGYAFDDVVTFDTLLERIPEPFRERALNGVHNSIHRQEVYSMEHPIEPMDGTRQRWVRAMGRLYPNPNGKLSNFSGLLIDITEQKLEDMRKSDFISMVSHELKTPLTSLSGIVQLLQSKLMGHSDEFVAKAPDKIINQVKRMNNLINGFLSVSRLENSGMVIKKKEFDLVELLGKYIDEASMTSPSYSIHYHGQASVLIDADREKIGSVISNLLSNAIKYSPANQNIDVRCEVSGEKVTVSIEDKGVGISEQDIGKIFDRYYRVETSYTRYISGFGIGLYLSAEIIHLHEGEIWVESEPGIGSTFRFSLKKK